MSKFGKIKLFYSSNSYFLSLTKNSRTLSQETQAHFTYVRAVRKPISASVQTQTVLNAKSGFFVSSAATNSINNVGYTLAAGFAALYTICTAAKTSWLDSGPSLPFSSPLLDGPH